MIRFNPAQGNPRRFVYFALVGLSLLILALGFYNLQVLQENVYLEKSLKNSVKIESQFPVRGLIYDRNGILIADNRSSFSVYLIPAQTTDHTIAVLSEKLGISEKDIRRRFRQARRFQPVKIARYVEYEDLVQLQENRLELPGLEWKVEPKRNYNFTRGFAHVLGTLGEIGEDELSNNPEYESGDVVGKKGVEKALDSYLRGKKGYKYVKVDALGRTVENVQSGESTTPYPGSDVYLTLDARLQMFADSLLHDHTGALVAIDPRNGEVISLVSKPDYDLNYFAEAVDPQIWGSLISDASKPLYDRAAQATYPPGSTYKMIAAIAALNEKLITPAWRVNCPGYFRIGRRTVRCWNAAGHGELDLIGAIRNSCNVYFYQLGLKIGIEFWTKYSRLFQFGKRTGIELTTESAGLVPSKEYYDRSYGEGRWTRGMLANLAIGQGELLVTPLQMAQFAMILADSGSFYQPHLSKMLVDKVSGLRQPVKPLRHSVSEVEPQVFAVVREGMHQVMQGGTGWRANVWKIGGAGKTGTAQNPHGEPHAWFIGFAPFEAPEIAIAIVIENGGSGGGVAAPIAGEYLRRYFHYQGRFDYKAFQEYQQRLWRERKEQARLDSLKAAGVVIPGDTTGIGAEN